MKIEINFDDIELGDWLDYDPNEEDAPTLKEIFREEIKEASIKRLNYDYSIKRYIEQEIQQGLYNKIMEIKDDTVINSLVRDAIDNYVNTRGNTETSLYGDSYIKEAKDKIKALVESRVEREKRDLENALDARLRCQISKVLDEIYEGKAIGDYIDKSKLTDLVINTLNQKGVCQ